MNEVEVKTDKDINPAEKYDDWIIFWQRMANSGVLVPETPMTLHEVIKFCCFNPKFVKAIVVRGKIVHEQGKAN